MSSSLCSGHAHFGTMPEATAASTCPLPALFFADTARSRALAARVLTTAAEDVRCGGDRAPPKVLIGQPAYAAPPAVANVCQEWKEKVRRVMP